jgi:hypothetical protein
MQMFEPVLSRRQNQKLSYAYKIETSLDFLLLLSEVKRRKNKQSIPFVKLNKYYSPDFWFDPFLL